MQALISHEPQQLINLTVHYNYLQVAQWNKLKQNYAQYAKSRNCNKYVSKDSNKTSIVIGRVETELENIAKNAAGATLDSLLYFITHGHTQQTSKQQGIVKKLMAAVEHAPTDRHHQFSPRMKDQKETRPLQTRRADWQVNFMNTHTTVHANLFILLSE